VRRGPFDRLAVAASLVFLADFSAKQWALRTLAADGDRSVTAGWHLAIVNNSRLAGGLESGGLELPLTAILTTIVVALVLRVCRQVAAVDREAPTALGMLVGAGTANLADALIPPHGVVDFIAFTSPNGDTTSFNVADIALLIALVLCVRTGWRIAQAMRGRLITESRTSHRQLSGAPLMRDRMLLSAGHGLLAMCAFVWLYSMAIAWTPDAGRSAPNSLYCGVGVFAVAFLISRARMRIADRRLITDLRPATARLIERVVLDGSIPVAASIGSVAVDGMRPGRRDVTISEERASGDPGAA
jgi:lipoprotein signal peptidase